MRKIKFCGLPIIGLIYLMSSCLGSDETISDDWHMGNAQISAFSVSNDSISGLASVKFTIDQLNGKIYNRDSMPYGTLLDEKLKCNITFEVGAYSVIIVQHATGDTVTTVTDSVDFSAPVTITIYPFDGLSSKTYEAKINIHQVNPDSMAWQKYSDLISGKAFDDMQVISYNEYYYMYASESSEYNLYRTGLSDMVNWENLELSGFPSDAILSQITEYEGNLYVISRSGALYYSTDGTTWLQVGNAPLITNLLGHLPENTITKNAALLAGITVEDNILYFTAMSKDMEWTTGNPVPETFPLSGFGRLNHVSMHHPRLVLASGRDIKNGLSNKAWSTMDGLSWVTLSNNTATFTPREGAAISTYDNKFFLLGGIDNSGAALNDVYSSKDNGVTWLQDTVYTIMPEEYTARGFSSVFVSKDNYMLLFGGKAGKDTKILNELWRGRINRLGFNEQ